MFGAEFAEIYDLTYRLRGKDYAAEADWVTRLVRQRRPDAGSLLDVACGTGEHLARFRAHFAEVAGVDRSPAMLDVARAKLPGVPVWFGDMCELALGRTFGVVTCLFSSVGYLDSPEELAAAVAAMARHLDPGGVLVVEPLWFPEDFRDGYVAGDVLRDGARTLARVSHSRRTGRAVRMDIHYLLADSAGIRHVAESHRNTLFSREEYLTAFDAAGCVAEYLPGGPGGRGLFVGSSPGRTS
ncbi:class I SAM-dependent methyltransferase [Plantactinospora endophytica]|uniref:class I SAM-dependent methyltransferase n=1 Tax=Plantactinospora endophytica TaxID=673535 RepID=UPI001943ECA5|nr:class I SAM-dependent methyltransferase [Plantactinospora endophytica]